MDEQVKLMNQVLHQQNYDVLAKLSEGSYGEIFLVEHKESGLRYVLKALEIEKLKKQQRLHQAFIQALILRKLNHPGVIKLYQTIQRESYFSQIIEYCPNGDVFKLIAQVNHDLALVKRKKEIMYFYLAEILEAISYLHEKSIIHRDLKPQNIVLSSNMHIKIIDFGTALINNKQYLTELEKQSYKQLKKTDKELVGSAHYLSPQALHFQYSQKSDIWAFGVIVYKFYHNTLPFVGANNFEIFKSIKQKEPEISQSIPLDVKQLITSCLKKNAEQRPTAAMLKNYSFFKGIKFGLIFNNNPPLSTQQFKKQNARGLSSPTKKSQNEQLFASVLQKRMFFGNYKPRILSVYRKRGALYFAYKYVDTKIVKNQVQLNMNDYCQKIANRQMQIKADDKKYVFRCQQIQSIQKMVEQINSIIRQHFKLVM